MKVVTMGQDIFINRLFEWIDSKDWISNIHIKNVSALLDERDKESFSARWMEAYKSIEDDKKACHVQNDVVISKIREQVYLQIFDRWKSSDLAACVSEDFGLIGDGILLDSSLAWINGLFQVYLNRQIPVGNIKEITGKLSDLVP